MKNTQLIPFFFSILFMTTTYGQKIEFLEITKTDVTLYPEVKSDKITVFDIHLGMTQLEAINLLKKAENLYFYVDEGHSTKDFRIYVSDRNENMSKRNTILYLIWTDGRPDLSKITFFEDFNIYLQGSTLDLLSIKALNPDDSIVKNYLGKWDRSEVTLDISSIKLKHTTYYFASKGIQITHKKSIDSESTIFAFYLLD